MSWTFDDVHAGPGGRPVLQGVSLTVALGEMVGVIGPNGAGKTTLLRAGLGLLPLQAGQVRLAGKPLANLKPAMRARAAGYLPQERRVGWNLAAMRIVELGAPDLPEGQARALAAACLDRVGLAGFEGRGVLDLSGGERARVLLARLLATRAPLLVADEPTAGLDPDAQFLALDLLAQEAARGAAVVVTLHDLGLAARVCDRLIVLHAGRVAADGPPSQVLTPATLRIVFGLDGAFIDTEDGPVLVTRRAA
ncbi:MAG: ABC transporter ATP-binding protein [Caulobacteraceae bacterium]|nr:MAG: ABC transporter ATP-binding protein [Caulobacteraceae bacterium]